VKSESKDALPAAKSGDSATAATPSVASPSAKVTSLGVGLPGLGSGPQPQALRKSATPISPTAGSGAAGESRPPPPVGPPPVTSSLQQAALNAISSPPASPGGSSASAGPPAAAGASAASAPPAVASSGPPGAGPPAGSFQYLDWKTHFFSHEALKAKAVPVGVDPAQRELYLSDEDFKKYFGKTKEEFQALPRWKQIQAKQTAQLY
jgi:hypothetical protein